MGKAGIFNPVISGHQRYNMFNLFKKRSNHKIRDIQLLQNIFTRFPTEFDFIIEQMSAGLIKGFKKSDSPIRNFHKIAIDISVLNKFENKKKGFYCLQGVEVFDLVLQEYSKVSIYIASDILMGYATPKAESFTPDISKIKIQELDFREMGNSAYSLVTSLLTKEEIDFTVRNDVYALELDNKVYYHLMDLEDGDFIAIDDQKKVYRITHDPYDLKN